MKLTTLMTVSAAMTAFSIAALPAVGEIKIQVRDGFPIVDGVYVNGHGPYRFLLDTGTNVDLIEPKLARSIGLTATFQRDLVSSSGVIRASGGDGFEVALDTVRADKQRFLFVRMGPVRERWPDVQGVLGQAFLLRFDYLLDLHGKRFEIGRHECSGTRTRLTIVNGRPVVATSLGDLVLDTGASRLTLFGVEPQTSTSSALETVSGSQAIGMVSSRPLFIEGRKILPGQTVAVPRASEPGVRGLLPVSLFRGICVGNSEGYVVFE
jgi:hypothetical protein